MRIPPRLLKVAAETKYPRMMLGFFLVLIFVSNALTTTQCPTNCSCTLDFKGRKTVVCNEGGLVGPISLTNVSLDTEVLRITAPDDNTNMLTMSPVFGGFKNLEEIHITKSNIPQLGQYFFWDLRKLDVLNLSQNNITQPLDHDFKGLDKLKELYLDDNRIQSLPSNTFRYLQSLKVLSIQRNRITKLVNRVFIEIGRLKILKLSGNNLKTLNPEVFRDVQELRTLECRGCALKTLHKEIYDYLPQLTHLDLGDNEIQSIAIQDLQALKSLRHLRLDGNEITVINDNVFIYQASLRKLNLGCNEISRIGNKAFTQLFNLTELDLRFNRLEHVYGIFEPILSNLELLILSGNHLKLHSLTELSSMDILRELRLANCDLVEINERVFPTNLELLDLSGNHLSTIRSQFLPSSLKLLDVSRNGLKGIEEDDLRKLERIPNLKLQHNPWSCDLCYIVPLLERTNRSATFSEIVCVSPYTTRGKKLGSIQKEELTWCTAGNSLSDADFFLVGGDKKIGLIAAGMLVTLLLLTLLTIIGVVLYSKRHAAKYYTHEEKFAIDGENMYENHSPLFNDGELSFKFPLDGEKKMSICTIEDIKKEHSLANGT
ncbi:toll-like receptor 6 [Cylas formicarius]|uniref:toll-like receptor 6 n=1 Tax=Cylas formicarius TaxID=197179 RepID=UPI002958827E|nr:toll-like receptor 6 [Cylas formicarius]